MADEALPPELEAQVAPLRAKVKEQVRKIICAVHVTDCSSEYTFFLPHVIEH
jgi:hypothetical protein